MAKLKKIDIIIPLLLLVYSIYYYLEVASLDSAEIALLLIEPVFYILTVSVILHLIIQFVKSKKESDESTESNEKQDSPIQLKKTILFCGLTILYVFLLGVIGFVVSTLVYTLILMLVLGVKSMKVLIPVPLLLIAILYVSLHIWLNIPLPKGFLI